MDELGAMRYLVTRRRVRECYSRQVYGSGSLTRPPDLGLLLPPRYSPCRDLFAPMGSLVAARLSIPVPRDGETAAEPRFRCTTQMRRSVCGAPTAPRTLAHLRWLVFDGLHLSPVATSEVHVAAQRALAGGVAALHRYRALR